VFYKILGKDN